MKSGLTSLEVTLEEINSRQMRGCTFLTRVCSVGATCWYTSFPGSVFGASNLLFRFPNLPGY